jgi:hypothetical protein
MTARNQDEMPLNLCLCTTVKAYNPCRIPAVKPCFVPCGRWCWANTDPSRMHCRPAFSTSRVEIASYSWYSTSSSSRYCNGLGLFLGDRCLRDCYYSPGTSSTILWSCRCKLPPFHLQSPSKQKSNGIFLVTIAASLALAPIFHPLMNSFPRRRHHCQFAIQSHP